MALQLKRQGIDRVRPLLGGLAGWIDQGFPVAAVTLIPETAAMGRVDPHA